MPQEQPAGPAAPNDRFTRIGAALMALGVGIAAFGAHGLEDVVTPERLDTWQTGARMHLLHGLGLILLDRMPSPPAAAGWLMVAGVTLFSGSLYVLVLTDTPALGAVTPLGGICFIAAWAMLAYKGVNP